jgi:hypothetical protein
MPFSNVTALAHQGCEVIGLCRVRHQRLQTDCFKASCVTEMPLYCSVGKLIVQNACIECIPRYNDARVRHLQRRRSYRHVHTLHVDINSSIAITSPHAPFNVIRNVKSIVPRGYHPSLCDAILLSHANQRHAKKCRKTMCNKINYANLLTFDPLRSWLVTSVVH